MCPFNLARKQRKYFDSERDREILLTKMAQIIYLNRSTKQEQFTYLIDRRETRGQKINSITKLLSTGRKLCKMSDVAKKLEVNFLASGFLKPGEPTVHGYVIF